MRKEPKMGGKCVVITGGDFSPVPRPAPGDFVIACDLGYEYALRCGLRPDLLIGDFDSYTGALPADIPIERFRAEKDDTDTMIAVRYAIEHGFEEIELRCALGGRLDHTLANLQSMVFAAEHGLTATAGDQTTCIRTMTPGELVLSKREGWSLSVFAAKDLCTGVCIRGAKYPLDNADVTSSFPIGVSNAWKDGEAHISLGSGVLLIVMSRYS